MFNASSTSPSWLTWSTDCLDTSHPDWVTRESFCLLFWYTVLSFWNSNLVHGIDYLIAWGRQPGYTITLSFYFCTSPGSMGGLNRLRAEFPQSSQTFTLSLIYFKDLTKPLSYFVASFDFAHLYSSPSLVGPQCCLPPCPT